MRETFRYIRKLFICACLVLCSGFAMPNMGNAFAGQCTIPSSSNGSSATTGGVFTVTYYTSNPGGTVVLAGGTGCSTTEYYKATHSYVSGTTWYWPSCKTCSSGYTRTLMTSSTMQSSFGCEYAYYTCASASTCAANQYWNGSKCTSCPSGYPYSAGGEKNSITTCYSATKSRAVTCTQNTCSKPSGCASVTCASSCSCSGSACDYVAYSNSAGTGDGTIKSGCSSNAKSCTKAVSSVTASAGYYVSNTTSCSSCTDAGTSYTSDGGSIGKAKCYRNVTRSCTQNNGSTPTGCASVTAWNACSCAGGTYKSYFDGSTSGTTSETCTKTAKTVTASANYYVSGAACPACSSYSSTYTKSDGGSISSSSCYTNVTRGCTQNNGSTPSGCASVTAWNACSCAGGTYKKYASGSTSGTTTNETCTKTPKTVTAASGFFVSNATCPACTTYSSSYPLSDGGSITATSCYTNVTRSCTQYNGSTPSGCASVTAWNACSCAGGTYKKYAGGGTSGTTSETCTKTPKTVTASSNYYVSGTTCPSCSSKSSSYPYSAGGSIDYNSCYTNVTRGCTQNTGSTPSGCYQVVSWNSCSCAGNTYKKYYNGTTSGTTSNESCTKTPATVAANQNHYVSGTTCPACSSKSSTYTLSNGGSIDYNSCYTNITRSCSRSNGSIPSGCASVTAWNTCSCAGGTYKKFYNGTTSGTTSAETCTNTPKTVTASSNYYVSGTTCPSCSSKSSSYPYSAGGSIDYNSCYTNVTRGCTQNTGSTPSGCSGVSAWNACSCAGGTYVQYYNGTTSGTTSNETCTKTVKTVSGAQANYYVSGTTCPSCSSKSSSYPYSAGGAIDYNSCYTNVTRSCQQNNGEVPSGCAAVSAWNSCSCAGNTYKKFYNGTTSGTTVESCTKTVKTPVASPNYYVNGTTCPSCSSKNSSYPSSDGGTIDYNSCYVTKTNTGYEVAPSLPTGCAAQTVNSCTKPTCSYKDYLGQSGETCDPGTCNQTHNACTSTISNYYLKDGKPEACPTGYPYSAAGATAITSCYSGSKSRAWTGSAVNGNTPDGCYMVTEWNSCSVGACSYVAYSNSAGTGDGTIKSGCSSNSANCTKTIKSVTANQNHYVSGTTCPACSSIGDGSFTESDGANISSGKCYKTVTLTGTEKAAALPTGCTAQTENSCTKPTCSYKDYYGETGETCSPGTCQRTHKTCTYAGQGYYLDSTVAKQCPTDYPYSAAGATAITSCYSGNKSRAWTGEQLDGPTPDGCYQVVSWNSCSIDACSYTAYSNSTGNGDGTIKSGCSSNSANCTKTPKTVGANPGYYVDGVTCPSCSGKFPDYPESHGGALDYNWCYKTVKRGCVQKDCSAPSGCATVTCASSCTCEGGSYLLYSNGDTAGVTEDETCTKAVNSVAAAANNYVSGKSCLSCSTKNADYPNSNGGTGGHTICFSNSKWRDWNGKEEEEELPSGCANGTWGSCSHPRCEYVAYLNEAGTGDGIIKSGCETNDEVCTKGLETLQAKSGHYVDGNTCPSCSDKNSGYPYSAGGNISYTSCYSGTKSRAWSGSQTPCEKPDNSVSYSCDTCAGTACDYVAYLNSAGTGDGTIKSGCSTNTTACQQNVKSGSVTCNTGFYTSGVTCPACTNKPDNSAYTGTATSNACPWECDTGYGQTSANLCAQMCTAGIQYLKSSTGISIPLYTLAQTTHSIVVKTQAGNMCYASLASGEASGAINVNLDGTTYHAIK